MPQDAQQVIELGSKLRQSASIVCSLNWVQFISYSEFLPLGHLPLHFYDPLCILLDLKLQLITMCLHGPMTPIFEVILFVHGVRDAMAFLYGGQRTT